MSGPRAWLDGLIDRFVLWLDRVAEDGLLRLMWWRVRLWFGHGLVASKLLTGERVIAEVLHSAVLYVWPALVGLLGAFLAVRWLPFVPVNMLWFAVILVGFLLGYAFYKALSIARDRFVITDSRVFRVWGVESLHEAEMEIGRVLDVTVNRPWWLRPVGSGHLVLENAAQQQGLRDISYIPKPNELAKEIHTLRREAAMRAAGGAGVGAAAPPGTGSDEPPVIVYRPRRRADHPRQQGRHPARRR